jgi:hypothetical protein
LVDAVLAGGLTGGLQPVYQSNSTIAPVFTQLFAIVFVAFAVASATPEST